MHDIRWIRDNPQEFDRRLNRRPLDAGTQARFSSKALLAKDEARRALIGKLEAAQARRNAASKEIGEAKKAKDEARAAALMAEVASFKTDIPKWEKDLKEIEKALDDELAQIPNLPLDEVPDGADEHGNVEHHIFGAKRAYAFTPKQHFDLGEALGQMDFETASKLSGARFVVLQKGLARLERALGQFMLDIHTTEHGYTEVNPPLLVRDEVMYGTAQLPKFKDDQFFGLSFTYTEDQEETAEKINNLLKEQAAIRFDVQAKMAKYVSLIEEALPRRDIQTVLQELIQGTLDTLLTDSEKYQRQIIQLQQEVGSFVTLLDGKRWLIPTAEVPLTNLVRESILDEEKLPLRFTACTPCFRAEAGAAGRDTRGMIRQHQFTKVELVSITTPEQSKDEHERMLSCAEEVLRRLDLHYRVVTLCTGDMGFASQKTYDIEVWLPGQGAYREISSCSVCGDFQARRMNARVRSKEGRAVRPVHTLNGSGVAVGRALIAVMENYQEADGSIAVPDVLQSYMGGMKRIEAAT